MLKLTLANTGNPIWIAQAHVVAILLIGREHHVLTVTGMSYIVQETPEHVANLWEQKR